jgi:hypothetical protein
MTEHLDQVPGHRVVFALCATGCAVVAENGEAFAPLSLPEDQKA